MAKLNRLRACCECGKQSITLSAAPVAQLICHCKDCRQVSGEDFTQIAFFMPEACEPQGEFTEVTMPGGSRRPKSYFSCPDCGVCLYATVSLLKGQVGVVANRILPPFEFAPRFHVWTDEKNRPSAFAKTLCNFLKGHLGRRIWYSGRPLSPRLP